MNIKRALEEVDNVASTWGMVNTHDIRKIFNALAEPEECKHHISGYTETRFTNEGNESICSKCKQWVKLNSIVDDPILLVYEKCKHAQYNVDDLWRAIVQYAKSKGVE